MKQSEFLNACVTTREGYFLLCSRDVDTGWHEHWFQWPLELGTILSAAQEHVNAQRDVYFTAHLFGEKRSSKNAVLPTRTIQADLDSAEVMAMAVVPSVIVCTSPGRHQGFWLLTETLSAGEIEELARRIAYGTRDCDRTGWPAGHRMRLPQTMNFKYATPAPVEVVGQAIKAVDVEAFHMFPPLEVPVAQAEADTAWITQGHTVLGVGPAELMASVNMPPNVTTVYTKAVKDRSKYLWNLMNEGFRRDLDRDQVYWLASQSVNNKYSSDRRYNAIADLRKDVLRAEAVANDKVLDIKATIMEWRLKTGVGAVQKRLAMGRVVLARMREDGELIHAKGGQLWFMRRDTGRPIELSERGVWFDAYLARTFALNATEQDARFVKQEVITATRNQAATADLVTLSYYEQHSNTLLLHTGGRDVLHIRAGGIETHPNGYSHTVFRVEHEVEPFKLGDRSELGGRRWHDLLFGAQMEHIDGDLTQAEAVALLRAWFLLILFRTHLTNRPILSIMGQPGAGKTTTAKKVYRLLYGRYKNISTISSPENFDTETVNYPFVCYDGVDTFEKWLPNALSLAASVTDVTKRRLYTDNDIITLRRQALLMLTAHNPRFTREDVVDRLIIIMVKRLPFWLPESMLLDEVSDLRNALWADIVADVQAILNVGMPSADEVPQFRIEDYALYGLWFSRALGQEKTFRSAMNKMIGSQKGVNLETDQLLVDTIGRWLAERAKHGHQPEYMQQVALWNAWSACTSDVLTFQKAYRNALFLGRKLTTMQDSLREVFDVDVQYNSGIGARTWKIGPKPHLNGATPDAGG